MKHIKYLPQAIILAAGVLASVPAWANPPAIAYSFGAASAGASGSGAPPPSRAPGADALRWLGGLGPTQPETSPAPIQNGSGGGRAVVAHH